MSDLIHNSTLVIRRRDGLFLGKIIQCNEHWQTTDASERLWLYTGRSGGVINAETRSSMIRVARVKLTRYLAKADCKQFSFIDPVGLALDDRV